MRGERRRKRTIPMLCLTRFRDDTREALAALPQEHPFRKRLARWAAAPASESPLWDSVLFFPPGAEWHSMAVRATAFIPRLARRTKPASQLRFQNDYLVAR